MEQIPQDLEMMPHLAAASCDIAHILNDLSIQASARKIQLLQIRDLRAVHMGIADQKAACRQCPDTGSDHVRPLVVDSLRLTRMNQRVIVPCIKMKPWIL